MNQSSQEFLDEFAAEAREHLASAGADLLALEKDPKDDTKNRLDRVFRGMHSIKGGAAFLGLQPVEKLAHGLESLLDLVRQGKKPPEGSLVDLALRGTDKLQAMVDDLPHADIGMIGGTLEEIEKFVKAGPKTNTRKVAAPAATLVNTSIAPPLTSPSEIPLERTSENSSAPSSAPGSDNQKNTTVRIPVELLDRLMNLAGELVLVRNRALQMGETSNNGQAAPQPAELRPLVQKLNTLTTDIQQTVLLTRLQPLGNLFGRFPRLVRNLARELDKEIDLEVSGSEVEMDKAIIDLLADPLTHLVRNSCDHGIEKPRERTKVGKPAMGKLWLGAIPEGGLIRIELRDDGSGIDTAVVRAKALEKGLKTQAELDGMSVSEIQALVFHPGFSTADKVTDLSGRGVGMDVVRTNVEMMGGTIRLESDVGMGTRIILRLPLTVAILPAMMVGVEKHRFALLQRDIGELICLEDGRASTGGSGAALSQSHDGELLRLRQNILPVVRLGRVLGLKETSTENKRQFAAILTSTLGSFCLLMDQLVSPAEIVVKRLPKALRSMAIYCGATIMGDGRTALILDAEGLAEAGGIRAGKEKIMAPSSLSQMREKLISTEGLILRSRGNFYFLPIGDARKLVPVSSGKIETIGTQRYFWVEGVRHKMHLLHLGRANDPGRSNDEEVNELGALAVLLKNRDEPTALSVCDCLDSLSIPGKIEPLEDGGNWVQGTLVWNGIVLRVLDVSSAKKGKLLT